MEIDLHVPFRDLNGNSIKNGNGEIEYIDKLICMNLFSGNFLNDLNDIELKFNAFTTCMKIYNAQGKVDITDKDRELIKLAASVLSPGGYGQVINILDFKPQL